MWLTGVIIFRGFKTPHPEKASYLIITVRQSLRMLIPKDMWVASIIPFSVRSKREGEQSHISYNNRAQGDAQDYSRIYPGSRDNYSRWAQNATSEKSPYLIVTAKKLPVVIPKAIWIASIIIFLARSKRTDEKSHISYKNSELNDGPCDSRS